MTTPAVTEIISPLYKSGSVVLGSDGTGVITFDPDNAWQRWEVNTISVNTNQDATATTVPTATAALNTVDASTMSQGNIRGGTSWSGNNDVLSGTQIDVSPGDFLSVVFQPPTGSTAAEIATLAGVTANAVVTGTKYTRRS
jgi:hypothetical protein